jgi:hypothetical protein
MSVFRGDYALSRLRERFGDDAKMIAIRGGAIL